MRHLLASLIVGLFFLPSCAGYIDVNFQAPAAATVELLKSQETFTLPCVRKMEDGQYQMALHISSEYARDRLGLEGGFTLYGFLTIGRPTENSKYTNVAFMLSDGMLLRAIDEGKVVVSRTYDEEADEQTLVQMKLGEKRPW